MQFCNHPPDHAQRLAREASVGISSALAHEIIQGGIECAVQYRFRPHSDFKRSRHILDPPDLHPRAGAVEFGHEGNYDNADAILRQLARTAGEGNTHYLMQFAGPPPDWDE